MYEETLILLKPDALERGLVGEIIHRYEAAGLRILDIRFYHRVDEDLVRRQYPDSMALQLGMKARDAVEGVSDPESHGLKVLEWLRRYLSRGPVIALKLGGENAIGVARRVTGYTDPSRAEKGTIRGDLGIDSIKRSTQEGRACENLVHASGSLEEAERELSIWFQDPHPHHG
jgi:nucleoside-diphosphate kinase